MQGPQTGVEYDESLTAGQRGGWGEHTFVPGGLGGPGDVLALRIVVAEEVVLIDPKVSTDLLVGQVEDMDIHPNPADPPTHLEGIDPLVNEVAEQLSPCRLLLVRCVPDAAPAAPVVATVRSSGLRTGQQVVAIGPWCQKRPVMVRRGADATPAAMLTRTSR